MFFLAFKCQHSHGEIWFPKRISIKIIFVPTSLEKELIAIYFHNHCAKYSKYEGILNSASDLQQQICSASLVSQKIDGRSLCRAAWMEHCSPDSEADLLETLVVLVLLESSRGGLVLPGFIQQEKID